jgi:hypothetical protein
VSLEAQLARKRRNAKVARERRKRGQYRRTLTIPGTQLRRLQIGGRAIIQTLDQSICGKSVPYSVT